jgi:phosphoribosylamine---glycine ligase
MSFFLLNILDIFVPQYFLIKFEKIQNIMTKINILLIGSGGREHALAKCLAGSASCGNLFASPANPGILQHSEWADVDISNFAEMIDFCEFNNIDLVVVGPEQPLAEGLADVLEENDIKCFGPKQYAARLESSKGFSKDFMQKYDIPTANYARFTKDKSEDAHKFINESKMPLVLKADGLAGGKGVLIPETYDEAHANLDEMFGGMFGSASDEIVIEEFMRGEEASVFAICDGRDFITLAPSQDHKRAFDGDKGPNTGGMGAYAPAQVVSGDVLEIVNKEIIEKVLSGMQKEGTPFVGCLYCGLMTEDGKPRVVEFNVRFGDPETQSVLSIFDGDLAGLFYSCASGEIDKSTVKNIANGFACNVVLSSEGYPGKHEKGFLINGIDEAEKLENVEVFQAGTKQSENGIVSNGGRVLSINGKGRNIAESIENAYIGVEKIDFENKFFRKDIGHRVK